MIPVLILGFIRSNGIKEILETGISSGTKVFYISIDGPRNSEDMDKQDQIFSVLKYFGEMEGITIRTRILTKNHGVGVAIISSLDWFFENEEAGIILEDDLRVSPRLFTIGGDVIKILKHNPKILLFSGTNFFENNNENFPIVRYPIIWGWISTRHNWKIMRKLIFEPIQTLSFKSLKLHYYYWKVGKRRVLRGWNNTWDIPLAAGMKNSRYFCLVSNTNLVTNIGFDAQATHTKRAIWPLNLDFGKSQLSDLTESKISWAEVGANEKYVERKIYKISMFVLLRNLLAKILDMCRYQSKKLYDLEVTISSVKSIESKF